jgi:iron complex transport system ATP-binding protein
MNGVSATDLSVSLGRTQVLRGVGLALNYGELTGVVGPNGAGKSTLLRALAGLASYDGSICLDGAEMREIPSARLAKLRAYLPQGGGVHWPLSVRAVTALGRMPFGDALTAQGRAAVDRAMDAARVSAFADRPVTELSGGERARALLSRALAAEAKVLIADEPAAQLDPRHAMEALDVLRAAAVGGALAVVALHDLTAAARLCHKVLVVDGGRAVAFGPPTQVLTPETLKGVFGVDSHIGQMDGAPFVVPLRPSVLSARQ